MDPTADLAVLLAASALSEVRRAAHARAVVSELGLDPRLEPLVPLPPRGARKRAAYEHALVGMREISAMPEPQRTDAVRQLLERFGRAG